MSITTQEALGLVQAQLKVAEAALAEATRIANEHGVSFYWDGPAYGMGGSYDPNPSDDDRSWGTEEGWNPSSMSGC